MSGNRLEYFEETPVVAALRGADAECARHITESALESGVRTIEFTYDTPGVLDTITDISRAYEGELHVGCGTILEVDDAERAVEAGAGFLVSPSREDDVIQWCSENGVIYMPGGFTPTEIRTLAKLNPYFVKVFPASTGAAEHIRQIRGPIKTEGVRLVVSGGVRMDNIKDFFDAGVDAITVGGSMLNGHLEHADWPGLTRTLTEAAAKARDFRKHPPTDPASS